MAFVPLWCLTYEGFIFVGLFLLVAIEMVMQVLVSMTDQYVGL